MDWPTILVAAAVAGILAAIVVTQIRNKKKGKGSCSCGGSCGGCPMSGACHPSSSKR